MRLDELVKLAVDKTRESRARSAARGAVQGAAAAGLVGGASGALGGIAMRDPVNAALREGLRQGQYPGPLKRISRRQAVAVGGLVGGLMNIPGGVAYGATLGAALPKQKRDTTKVAYLVKRARYQDSGREADVRAAQIGGVLAGSVGAARTGKGTYEAMKMVLREASKVPGSRHLGRAGPFYARALTGGLAGAGAGAAGWAGPGAIVGVAGSKLLRKAKKEGDK